jgi:arginase family enzyme
VDVRNLDQAEEQLIRATDAVIAAVAPGFAGVPLDQAVANLAKQVDQIYFHIDADILDERYTPNHGTKAAGGPSMDQAKAAIETVMSTGKVTAFAVVSVSGTGTGAEVMVASGMELIRDGLTNWQKFGQPEIKIK